VKRSTLITAGLLALASCSSPTGWHFSISGAVALAAPVSPATMDNLWASVQACSGIRTSEPWHRVSWYSVPGDRFAYGPGDSAIGLWVSPHQIYLAAGPLEHGPSTAYSPQYDTLLYESTIRHEMLHDLTQAPGHGPAFTACHLAAGPGVQ